MHNHNVQEAQLQVQVHVLYLEFAHLCIIKCSCTLFSRVPTSVAKPSGPLARSPVIHFSVTKQQIATDNLWEWKMKPMQEHQKLHVMATGGRLQMWFLETGFRSVAVSDWPVSWHRRLESTVISAISVLWSFLKWNYMACRVEEPMWNSVFQVCCLLLISESVCCFHEVYNKSLLVLTNSSGPSLVTSGSKPVTVSQCITQLGGEWFLKVVVRLWVGSIENRGLHQKPPCIGCGCKHFHAFIMALRSCECLQTWWRVACTLQRVQRPKQPCGGFCQPAGDFYLCEWISIRPCFAYTDVKYEILFHNWDLYVSTLFFFGFSYQWLIVSSFF